MPAISQHALTLVQCVYYPALQIGDGQFIQVNDAAAELYGYARASDLVGRYLSDVQLPISRDAGSARWVLRQYGHDIPPAYCTLIRRPDGEEVGHRGTLVSTMEGVHGQSYLTSLELVRELDEPPVPDLEAYGVSEEQRLTHTGRFTTAEVRAMSRERLTLHFGERFPMIIEELKRVSTDPLGFALSEACTWSLSDKSPTLVYFRHQDPTCGRAWDARKPQATQCPSCKAHLERYS